MCILDVAVMDHSPPNSINMTQSRDQPREIHARETFTLTSVSAYFRYLYLDEVHLSDATCMGIMYAAKKYMVKSLRDKCAAYLQKHIQIQTVWSVLEHSLHLDEPELVNCALEFVDENAEECLGSRQFTQISHGTLCKVLERDTLHVEEVLVFRACLEWAGVRCLDEGVPVSVDRIRKDLGKALYLIRFPLMEISDFSNTVVSEGLLSDKEVISVFLALTREKTPADLKFSDVEREGASGTTVWVTGVARAATTLSAKAFESGRLYHNLSGKYIRLRSVFFALHSREVLRKLKTVKVLATETNVTYQTQVFRETKLPKNDFVNVKAVFKEKVMLLAGNYFVFTLEFDSALKPAEVVYFSGSPVMAIKGQNCSFNSSAFFHFVGITFEE